MIRVMVVDDSALVRKMVSDMLTSDAEITVVATAAQAEFAIAKLQRERPDVITLDLEMPGMGGLEAIKSIMAVRPTPIIILSAFAESGAEQTLQALDLGAVDFVLKPSGTVSGSLATVARELIEKIKIASGANDSTGRVDRALSSRGNGPFAVRPVPRRAAALHPPQFEGSMTLGKELIAIGTSTGGPVALKTVLTTLPSDLPAAVVVVQHMPPVFTRAFADRLDGCCEVRVKEAEDGDVIVPGVVLLAPGDWHMTVDRRVGASRVHLTRSDTVNGHRPSVDVLMHSVAREYGRRSVGVIMTGMGRDGADGLIALHRAGGYVIAQDKESSVIFGMNKEAIQNGSTDEIVPLGNIAERIVSMARGA